MRRKKAATASALKPGRKTQTTLTYPRAPSRPAPAPLIPYRSSKCRFVIFRQRTSGPPLCKVETHFATSECRALNPAAIPDWAQGLLLNRNSLNFSLHSTPTQTVLPTCVRALWVQREEVKCESNGMVYGFIQIFRPLLIQRPDVSIPIYRCKPLYRFNFRFFPAFEPSFSARTVCLNVPVLSARSVTCQNVRNPA